jgi:hypothetical protein
VLADKSRDARLLLSTCALALLRTRRGRSRADRQRGSPAAAELYRNRRRHTSTIAEQRRATRQEKSRPIVVDLEPWLRKNSGLASQKTKLANADPPHHRREPEAAAPGPHRSAQPTLVPDFAPNDAGLRPSPATNLHINACRFAVEAYPHRLRSAAFPRPPPATSMHRLGALPKRGADEAYHGRRTQRSDHPRRTRSRWRSRFVSVEVDSEKYWLPS